FIQTRHVIVKDHNLTGQVGCQGTPSSRRIGKGHSMTDLHPPCSPGRRILQLRDQRELAILHLLKGIDDVGVATSVRRGPCARARVPIDSSSLDFQEYNALRMRDNKIRLTVPSSAVRAARNPAET